MKSNWIVDEDLVKAMSGSLAAIIESLTMWGQSRVSIRTW